MAFADCISKGLRSMSKTKDISKKRFSEFLAARLRAKRGDANQAQHASPASRTSVSTRAEEKPTSVIESRSQIGLGPQKR